MKKSWFLRWWGIHKKKTIYRGDCLKRGMLVQFADLMGEGELCKKEEVHYPNTYYDPYQEIKKI